jgi:hypothetical protein
MAGRTGASKFTGIDRVDADLSGARSRDKTGSVGVDMAILDASLFSSCLEYIPVCHICDTCSASCMCRVFKIY